MTIQEIVRAAIPDASDDLCHHILWGRTAFPFKKLTARDIYLAAHRLRRANANNLRLCDHCDHVADYDEFECKRCYTDRTTEPVQ